MNADQRANEEMAAMGTVLAELGAKMARDFQAMPSRLYRLLDNPTGAQLAILAEQTARFHTRLYRTQTRSKRILLEGWQAILKLALANELSVMIMPEADCYPNMRSHLYYYDGENGRLLCRTRKSVESRGNQGLTCTTCAEEFGRLLAAL